MRKPIERSVISEKIVKEEKFKYVSTVMGNILKYVISTSVKMRKNKSSIMKHLMEKYQAKKSAVMLWKETHKDNLKENCQRSE